MSERDGTSAWVSDLDRCVSIAFDEDDERVATHKLLASEPDETGEFRLLADRSISSRLLSQGGVTSPAWRHAIHQSQIFIGYQDSSLYSDSGKYNTTEVTRFVKAMMELGRPYAILRYARMEHLDYSSALTATFLYGISAQINQFLASEEISRTREVAVSIGTVLKRYEDADITAYRRTGMLQATLYRIANDTPNHSGGAALNRDRMRAILSLARLYFSTAETKLSSLEELRAHLRNYEHEREISLHENVGPLTNRRFIRSWRLRYIQPLFSFYPYSIRFGLLRALGHGSADFDRTALVNELALAQCGLFRMREAGKARTRAKRK
jgi:hypothetical protein